MYQYDLRPLFLHDPYEHSGLYDSDETGLVALKNGNFKATTSKYIQVVPEFRDEAQFQRAIARLIVEAAIRRTPRHGKIGAVVSARLRGVLLLSPNTINEFIQKPFEAWRNEHSFSRRIPRQFHYFEHFFRNGRQKYLHPAVPDGMIIGISGGPEDLGVISTPQTWPYPVGVGIRDSSNLQAYLIRS